MKSQLPNSASSSSLSGKVALVTGGANGIGRAIAECFAEQGAQVVLLDRADDVLQVANSYSENMHGIQLDVTNKAEVEQALEAAVKHFGQIDILVNSAGIVILQPAEEVSEDARDKTIAVNLKGCFWLAVRPVSILSVRVMAGSSISHLKPGLLRCLTTGILHQ